MSAAAILRLLIILATASAGAQNVNLIAVRPSDSAVLMAAHKASIEAQKVADAKYQTYYNLTQKVRRDHGVSECAAFTGDFRWIVRGAYSPLNSASGVVSTTTCYEMGAR